MASGSGFQQGKQPYYNMKQIITGRFQAFSIWVKLKTNRPTAIRPYLQATVRQSTPENRDKLWIWILETGDPTCRPATGAAAPGMEEGPRGTMPPYPPSPVVRRCHLHSVPLGFLRSSLGSWLPGSCRVCLGVTLLALGCAASAHMVGMGKRKLGWATGPKFQSNQPGWSFN
jgi:hypothetical protein